MRWRRTGSGAGLFRWRTHANEGGERSRADETGPGRGCATALSSAPGAPIKMSSDMMQQGAVDQSAPRPRMPPAPEGRRRPYGDDAASRGALQPRQIFEAHRDAAESTRTRDLEAGGGAGSAPGN